MAGSMPTELPHDIYGLNPYAVFPWFWLVVALAVIAGAGIFLWLWRKRRKPQDELPPDPWAVMNTRLRRMEPTSPFDQTAQKEFYFAMSLLLREAVEERCGVRATDMTTRELETPLQSKVPLPGAELTAMIHFFQQADVVKFADGTVTLSQAQEDYQKGQRWLARLKPLPVNEDTALFVADKPKGGLA